MSVYSKKGRGWRYDFTLNGIRHTEAWFETKKAAKQAEALKRKELTEPQQKPATEYVSEIRTIQTDMVFLDLVNKRLDHLSLYGGEGTEGKHYKDSYYMARRWVKNWGDMHCSEITRHMILDFVRKRAEQVSTHTGNKEIRYLKALFNFGINERLISTANPVKGIKFLPVTKKKKKPYIPASEDLDRIIAAAEPDVKDYLWVIRETLGRVGEINRLEWDDVDLKNRTVTLHTRKKRGGNLTPRSIPMTGKLYEVLSNRAKRRDPDIAWVFWHRYWSSKTKEYTVGPFKDRKKIMKSLCKKAGVNYFRYHPIRHSGASILDNEKVPIGVTQNILGHENRKTTEIYLHTLAGAERMAMDIFERARKKSHTESHTEQERV